MSPWGDAGMSSSLAEVVWTVATVLGSLMAAIGLAITRSNLLAALRAHRRARATVPVNHLHTAITEQSVRNEAISVIVLALLLVKLLLYAWVGVVALGTSEIANLESVEYLRILTTTVLLIGATLLSVAVVLLSVGSIQNRRDRHRMTNRITGHLLREDLVKRRGSARRSQQGDEAP